MCCARWRGPDRNLQVRLFGSPSFHCCRIGERGPGGKAARNRRAGPRARQRGPRARTTKGPLTPARRSPPSSRSWTCVRPPPFSADEVDRLVTLADLGARCRSPEVRDRYKGDSVELVPEPESRGRLAGDLSQVADGMRAVGTPDDEMWRSVRELAVGACARSAAASATTWRRPTVGTRLGPSPPIAGRKSRRFVVIWRISARSGSSKNWGRGRRVGRFRIECAIDGGNLERHISMPIRPLSPISCRRSVGSL